MDRERRVLYFGLAVEVFSIFMTGVVIVSNPAAAGIGWVLAGLIVLLVIQTVSHLLRER